MAKPRITEAAVKAAYEVLDQYVVPDHYYQVSSDEQRRIRMAVMREALIAARLADQQSPPPQSNLSVEEAEQRAIGVGMAMAAAIVMRCWDKEAIAQQILDSAGLSTLAALKASCVEQYDIDALLPLLATTEGSDNG